MANAFNLFCDMRDQNVTPVQYINEKQVYIESVLEDHNVLNYINDREDCNLNTASNITEELFSTEYENVSQVVSIECLSPSTTTYQDNATRIDAAYEVLNSKLNIQKCQAQKFVHLQDSIVFPRALAMLPTALYFRRDSVIPRRSLPNKVKFGPVIGVNHAISIEESHEMVQEAATSKVPIFLKKTNGGITFIDVSDRDKSNWFSLLPLGDQNSANVWLHQEGEELYGIAIHSIAARTPLLLGYSKQYADENSIPADLPILDISQDLSDDIQQQCHELVRKSKKVRLAPRRGRLCCPYCTQNFCRIFTLKRHMNLYCTKRNNKIGLNKSDALPEVVQSTTINIEDKLPSDESLQNYSNGLDFSTNLFDTDRIPSLDISGGSKSEIEFNPYGVAYRDETDLDADLGSSANELDVQSNLNEDQNQSVTTKSFLITCQHCNETIVREKESQHLRECRERNLKCECGRVFKNRAKLAQHIHTQHRVTDPKDKKVDGQQVYQCEKCEHSYMRRGMLVNHMWQVHRARAAAQWPVIRVSYTLRLKVCFFKIKNIYQLMPTWPLCAVPLQRRVRHYPCVACPKLYRAAGKRDTHVRRHHPGVELVKGGSIDGGLRACEPAACLACPRQYVTRAKMLQHMRAAHPHLAPPKQKSFKSK